MIDYLLRVSPHERHCIEELTDVLEVAARELLK